MTTSFYCFLFGCVLAFLPAYWDHGKTLKEVRSSKGKKKFQKQIKLFVLWSLPISALVGTMFLGIEGIQDDRKYSGLTNDLGALQTKYIEATNDLATAKRIAANALSESRETSLFVNESNTKARLNEEQNTVAAAQSVLTNSNIAALKLLTPNRTITDEDEVKFIKLMEGVPRGNVGVFIDGISTEETKDYAEKIRLLIGACGYDVGRQCGIGWGGQTPKGVLICVRNSTNRPPFFEPLYRALKQIGIESKGAIDSKIDENTVSLYIGGKP